MDNRLYELNLNLPTGSTCTLPTLTTTELNYRETAKLYVLENSPSYKCNFRKEALNTVIKDYSFRWSILVIGKANIPLACMKLTQELESERDKLNARLDIYTKALKVVK